MRILNNFIFFSLIFISLSGLSNDIPLSKANVRYLKESEWIARPDFKIKVTKSVHFNHIKSAVSSSPPSRLWEGEFRNIYDRKLRVLFLFQARIFRNNNIANLISNKQYIPRLFTDDHNVSFQRSDLVERYSSASEITCEVRNSLWKHLMNSEWINQERNLNTNERDVSDGCQTGSL